jgi:hypothetical protein
MRRVKEGASLSELILLAIPLCRDAQQQCPRTGPGRKPEYEDWQIAVMIMCGVLKKKKSKSAQYRLVCHHAQLLMELLNLERIPARSSFYDRYKRVYPVVQVAIDLQGRLLLREQVADARVVAVDKSLLNARGPKWHVRHRKRGIVPRGVDREADWGYSEYRDWVYGYSYEVVVTATPKSVVMPLLASVDRASASEHTTFSPKIDRLPRSTRQVLSDPGYDDNNHAEQIELKRVAGRVRPTGRIFLCPPQRGWIGKTRQQGRREQQRLRRIQRHKTLRSRSGRRLYARRCQTVEPFNGTFKELFELNDHVWHQGMDNNRTQVLCAIFLYQLLIRWHWKHGGRNAQVHYIIDTL